MANNASLSVEQIRIIAAIVAPKYGPMCDHKMSLPFTVDNVALLVSRCFAASPELHAAIVSEAYPDTTTETHPMIVALRAAEIVAATLEVHDHREIFRIVACELANHSTALSGGV